MSGAACRVERKDVLIWALIVALALAMRLAFLGQFLDYPLARTLHMDPLIHDQWARAFLAGETFWEGAYFRAPLYPWFISLVYRVFGVDTDAVRVVQAVIGSLSCGMLFWVGHRAFGRRVGAVAGVLGATYWTLMYFDLQLLIPVLIVFLDLCLLWLLLWARDGSSLRRWGLAGLAMGLSAIARPNILLLAPFLVLWQLRLFRGARGAFLRSAAALTLGTLVPILPITARNWVVGHELSLIATQGGVNWYIGNNPGSDGMTAILPGDPADWWGCYNAQVERAERAMGRELTGTEVSRYYAAQARAFWREHTLDAVKLTLAKLGYFWTYWEIANTQEIQLVVERYVPLVRYLPHGFWLIGPLGALGLVIVMRRGSELFPLWGFVLIYMASVVAFFVTARYRIPVVHVLVILASYAGFWLAGALRERNVRALAGAVAVLVPMSLVVARVPGNPDVVRVQGLRTLGLQHFIDGDYELAAEVLGEAVELNERGLVEPKARRWFYLGYARHAIGDLEGAAAAYARAREIRAGYPRLAFETARLHRDLGRLEEARAYAAEAVARDPDDAQAHLLLSQVLTELGRPDEARAVLAAALERGGEVAAEVRKALQARGE